MTSPHINLRLKYRKQMVRHRNKPPTFLIAKFTKPRQQAAQAVNALKKIDKELDLLFVRALSETNFQIKNETA